MTTPPPPQWQPAPPPGGQPPPGPGMYGQPFPPGAAPQQGFPGQPGPGPYGAPPPQGPPGWGGPGGMPPIPPRSDKSKTWGVIGAIAGVLVIGSMVSAGIFDGGRGGSSGGSHAAPTHKVTVPQSLVGGEYTLEKDVSREADAQVPDDGPHQHNIRTVGGQYSAGTKSMVMLGMYGTIDDPADAVDDLVGGMHKSPDIEVAVTDRKFIPSTGGDPVTCGVDVKRQAGQKITLTFCAWADTSTSGTVAETDAGELAKDPASIDLQAFADKASKIREEVTRPLG